MHGTSHAGPSFLQRVVDACRRRARHWRRRWGVGQRPPAAEAALHWLRLCAGGGEGLHPTCGTSAECPGLSAAAIPTLWQLGETALALRFAGRLLELQKRDGSLPDAGLLHTSLFNTGQAVRAFALLTEEGALAAGEPALRRACNFLAGRVGDDGAMRPPQQGGSFDRWAPPAVHLTGLATVQAAAKRWNQHGRCDAAERAIRHALRTADLVRSAAPTHLTAHAIDALWELDAVDDRCGAAARRALEELAARQRADGSVPADRDCGWTSSAGLAHAALLWFRAGMIEPGRRAMACLAERQRTDGGWTGSWGRGAAYFPKCCSAWTAKYFLDAALAQVAAEFGAASPELVEPLAPDDGRLCVVEQLAAQMIADFGDDAELLDAGCGGGRYLRRLLEGNRRLRLTGLDPSGRLLEQVPAEAHAVVGSLLRLPLETERYAAVCCVEALEHALVPERAVDELCRVVCPGGRVAIIDKDARFEALSHVAPWERWFAPQIVGAWLSKHCDQVECRPLPHGPHQRTPGLFLCWTGVKRAQAASVPLRLAA